MRAGFAFDRAVRPSPDVRLRALESEAVVLDLKTEHYFGLDEVAARMWAVLEQSSSIGAAYETLRAEFDVDPSQLRADLERFVRELVDRGLLQVIDA